MSYTLSWETAGIYKRFTGFITAEEFLASIADFQSNPKFDAARYSINDFSDVEGCCIGPQDLRQFAALGAGAYRSNPHIKIAIVTKDAAIRDLISAYAGLGVVYFPLCVFETLAEARAWAVQ